MNSITQDTRQIVAVSQKMKDFFASYRIGHILHRANARLFFMSIDELADITLRMSLTLILLEVVREIDHSEQADSEMLADLVKKFIKSISNLLQGDKTVHDSGRLSPA